MANNPIEFWISYDNGAEKLRLPVNPETIEVTSPFGYEDVEVARIGEYTIIGERGLREVSFGSFFPRDYNPSYCEYADFPSPQECVNTIERWRDTRRPIRLTITGAGINLAVTLRSFPIEPERAGNPGDIYYEMSFKQYRFISFNSVKQDEQSAPETGTSSVSTTSESDREDPREQPKTYTVKSGDTLWDIANNAPGFSGSWRDIYAENEDVIGKDPDAIRPGMTLEIPGGDG
ncbi:LysM peptidoglycan-binding domain-containing protein [Salibacterium salarium]|uniref:LysM peptidoglycan-binding domain-containing protein n=1 Tax=Salibacterium salarium TaxID=284579 RepID=A0A3R9QMG5_9BACI|nr:LysM peptidoglycan-binding domain-containing protein [Salibacterium salarium]RSL29101.1 LysM peptidoglycan-binding domain-containing protein [Salibacterium salarium]